jgi:hypothetical protein
MEIFKRSDIFREEPETCKPKVQTPKASCNKERAVEVVRQILQELERIPEKDIRHFHFDVENSWTQTKFCDGSSVCGYPLITVSQLTFTLIYFENDEHKN